MHGAIILNENIQLNIQFRDSQFVHEWIKMVSKRPNDSLRLIDNAQPTIERFNYLRRTCDQLLNWNWSSLEITQENLNLMHKDLELLQIGVEKIPDKDHPVHELHQHLHQIEESILRGRIHDPQYLHFQSFHHDRIPIDDHTIYQSKSLPGALVLEYPYVGRDPISAMLNNDNQSLLQTCIPALDACAGFRVFYSAVSISNGLLAELELWLDSTGSSIKDKYGKDIILRTSHPAVVGHVVNLADFLSTRNIVIQSARIEF